MNTRPLSAVESRSLAFINAAGVESALIFLTATGMKKSIMDATAPVRALLRQRGVHDYEQQAQGQEHKRVMQATLLTDSDTHSLQMSLYRPKTKQGDPRLWISMLGKYASPDDVLALFIVDAGVHIANISQVTFDGPNVCESDSASIRLLSQLGLQSSLIAMELLSALREITNRGPLRAVCVGDTAIGRSVEAALGIPINSSKLPDYKGIELKSGRSQILTRENRANLFACVPDWSLSGCKSSGAILERFGYARGEQFKLYCTISAKNTNPQGLKLEVDELARLLREVSVKAPHDVAIWRMKHLEDRLLEKHRETFWIKARPERLVGSEYFHLESVVHTRNPNLPQLERLLSDGTVTVDHLIKRKPSGGAQEKGPLFKIVKERIPELFMGIPNRYSLTI